MNILVRVAAISVSIAILSGCASYTPEEKAEFVRLSIQQDSDIDLCINYLDNNRTVTPAYVKNSSFDGFFPFGSADYSRKTRAEAERRDLLNATDKKNLPRKVFTIGSSECGLFAVWGKPEDTNKTVTANKVDVQYVFCTERTYIGDSYICVKSKYAYTTNGIVTAWQE